VFLDPGWKKSGSENRKKHPRSQFKISVTIFWTKIHKFVVADPDPRSGTFFDPGSGMEKLVSRIRIIGAYLP
jgi:hypothetical protein